MTATSRFHELRIARVSPEAAGSVAIAFQVPDTLLERFDFVPGQYLTLRSQIDGADVRRSYSICSTHGHLKSRHELVVGIRPMEGGVFSNWAAGRGDSAHGIRFESLEAELHLAMTRVRRIIEGICA